MSRRHEGRALLLRSDASARRNSARCCGRSCALGAGALALPKVRERVVEIDPRQRHAAASPTGRAWRAASRQTLTVIW